MRAVPEQLLYRIGYLWRLLATGFSFAAFGLGGLALSLVVFPALNVAVADRTRRTRLSQAILHHAFRLFVGTMSALGVIAVEVNGGSTLRSDRGRLIIANHPSLIDVVLLVSLLRQTHCVVKHQNWRNPFMRGVLVATGYIRNDDDPESLIDACADVLRAGDNL
ncbi:MAG: 1-acyl-sn-glycerol-3-phosphate acyltransferase, partial [Pseudomonadota bacterium]